MRAYRTETFDFDLTNTVARRAEATSGCRVQLIDADPSVVVNVQVRGNEVTSEGVFKLKKGGYVEFPAQFDEVLFSWDAQPGKLAEFAVVDMSIPPINFGYQSGDAGVVDEIAEPVSLDGSDDGDAENMVQVTNSATKIADADPNRRSLAIQSSVDIWVAKDNTVVANPTTSDKGFKLLAGVPYVFEHKAAIYGITASGTANVETFYEGKA